MAKKTQNLLSFILPSNPKNGENSSTSSPPWVPRFGLLAPKASERRYGELSQEALKHWAKLSRVALRDLDLSNLTGKVGGLGGGLELLWRGKNRVFFCGFWSFWLVVFVGFLVVWGVFMVCIL